MSRQPFFTDTERPSRDAIRAKVVDGCGGTVLVGRGAPDTLHVPRGENERTRPLCHAQLERGEWRPKDLALYRGHKEFCTRCVALLFPERVAVEFSP